MMRFLCYHRKSGKENACNSRISPSAEALPTVAESVARKVRGEKNRMIEDRP